jgi:predicted Zn finger-like uncharacterized protein
MNIRCPNCQTVFRVDPSKIPPAGVRARCARCSATFSVKPPAAAATAGPASTGAAPGSAAPAGHATATPTAGPALSPDGEAAAGEASGASAHAPPPTGPAAAPLRGTASASPSGPAPPVAAPAAASPAAGPAAASTAAGATARTPVFGSRDPSVRAQRIARALVSDIVAYHPKRRDECLEAGTLRTEFREEIMKSWEEYVAQVGLDMAKSTPFFRQALNDILAKGQHIF